MANPELIRGFDLNDTNTEAIPEAKITDGYEQEEVLLSKNYNEVLKQLFAAANKNRNDGIWEWEDPTTNDTEYNISSVVSHNGEIFVSLIDNNEVEPTNDGTNWKSISDPNPQDTKLFAIAGGTANAITVTIPAIKEYSVNSTFRAKATITNTDAVIINVNGLGDKDVVIDNTALSGGEIISGKEYFFTYSSNGNFELTALGSEEVAFVANDTRVKTALNATGTAPIYGCRAWCVFDGTGIPTIKGSGNASSITDLGIGLYKGNLITAMPDANYSVTDSISGSTNAALDCHTTATNNSNTTTEVYIGTRDATVGLKDQDNISFSIFR